jgi:phage tail sheath protein FI
VYEQPAGVVTSDMVGVVGLGHAEANDKRKRDAVYAHRINPFNTAGPHAFLDGSRTLKATGSFPSVAERRGAMYIEAGLRAALTFTTNQVNTSALRAQVKNTSTSFLVIQMNNGAFRSHAQANAFFVDVSDALNPPAVVQAGKLVIRVGLAMQKPAVFAVLNLELPTQVP